MFHPKLKVLMKYGGIYIMFEYQLLCDYGYGWEYVLSEYNINETAERVKEYIENALQYPYKLVKRLIVG